jgi:hypothetical protein
MVVSDKPQRQPIAHPVGEEGLQNDSSWRQNIIFRKRSGCIRERGFRARLQTDFCVRNCRISNLSVTALLSMLNAWSSCSGTRA